MKWINSTGGPCIIISKKDSPSWSGIGSIEAAKIQSFEEVDNFMDHNQSHYGLACAIEDEIAIISINSEGNSIIVIGDEPSQMTIISNNNTFMVVKWISGESKEEFERYLNIEKLDNIDNWTSNFEVNLNLESYILIDSSESGFDFDSSNAIEVKVKKGIYSMDTNFFSPNEHISMNIHRFKINR